MAQVVGSEPVTMKKNPRYKADGRKAYLKAVRKWKFDPPDDGLVFLDKKFMMMMARAADGSTLGEVSAENVDEDVYYLCPVYIGEGENKQKVLLDFDTGSADLWVFTKKALEDEDEDGTSHGTYDPSTSKTMKPLVPKSRFRIDYADGSWARGDVVLDTVMVGGIKVENQAVECANDASPQTIASRADGLLGLAFGTLSGVKPKPVHTVVENMILQKDIKEESELFTCKLARYTEAPGFYTFGYIDKDTVGHQKIHYANIVSDKWWTYASITMTIDGEKFERPDNVAIPDTGTSLCLVSDDMCKKIYAKIPGAKFDPPEGGWVYPATVDVEKLPKIGLGVGKPNEGDGEKIFYIAPRDLAYAPASPGWIFGGIQSKGSMKEDLLGDVFLKNLYCIFDAGKKRFGCVQRDPVIIHDLPSFLNKGIVPGSVTDTESAPDLEKQGTPSVPK